MKKRIIIPAILLTGALAVGTLGVTITSAQTSYPPIVQKLAEKFNLNQADVMAVFTQVSDEKQADMYARWEERLTGAVNAGKITADQKQAILDEESKIHDELVNIKDLTPADRKAKMQQVHDEITTWAKENNIDLKQFGIFGFNFWAGKRN